MFAPVTVSGDVAIRPFGQDDTSLAANWKSEMTYKSRNHLRSVAEYWNEAVCLAAVW
jgi:hypothetical protein